MTDSPSLPSHQGLVDDLRVVREHGLVRLRTLRLPALRQSAALLRPGAAEAPPAIEEVIRAAADRLEAGQLADAARYTLGLVPGTRDWPAQDRRGRAAKIYGLTPGYFRKDKERVILEQVAEQIIAACAEHAAPPAASVPGPPEQALQPWTVHLPRIGSAPRVSLDVGSIELLRDVDVLVSSENVWFEMSKTFGTSLSAALRRAGALRTPAGEIIDDVVQRELSAWLSEHGRLGLPVAPGTVAATGPGGLAENGVKRVYHAAIAIPRPGRNAYEVGREVIPLAVRNVFTLAERERHLFAPPLSSLCFPLFGAGRGGLGAAASAAALWGSLARELRAAPGWSVRIMTINREHAAVAAATIGGSAP
ncbi:hypothetical protein E1264_32455 [Actinomadura sp. KC216]|uniref:hypothetical protein n=1 Tax=Actinomadura sp. KC216 TaxID=2530370 RepID=UPI001051FAE0|nr:hypothetical protein [Actinomadura sp. KC216]TDB81652.1 hypothetical protein E1264_32455 [Actinomadura sp. KC216]